MDFIRELWKMALDMTTLFLRHHLELLERYGVETKGKHTVVIGRSHIVGRPMSILMGRKGFPGILTAATLHTEAARLNAHRPTISLVTV
jgi:methylenetetrahydrofolate dehydrogenase (NADP+)/methenyltetrahydrofolate cyclohydrolase